MKFYRNKTTKEVILAADSETADQFQDVLIPDMPADNMHDVIEVDELFDDFNRDLKTQTNWKLGKCWLHDDGAFQFEELEEEPETTLADVLEGLGKRPSDIVTLNDLRSAERETIPRDSGRMRRKALHTRRLTMKGRK